MAHPCAETRPAVPDLLTDRKASDSGRKASISRPKGLDWEDIASTVRGPGLGNPEVEFRAAMNAYKASSGRMFPTWCEVLEVLCHLGYGKVG